MSAKSIIPVCLCLLCILALEFKPSSAGGLNTIEDFDSISFTSGKRTVQSLYKPPLQGANSLQLKLAPSNGSNPSSTGDHAFGITKAYSPAKDFSGKYMHIDVMALPSRNGHGSTPAIKLISHGRTVLEKSIPVRTGEWNGVNIDLSTSDQRLLSSIDRIEIYVSDMKAPAASYVFDDLFVCKEPLPVKQKTVRFILAGVDPKQAAKYTALKGPKVSVYLRSMPYDKNDPVIREMDNSGTKYYFTAASSDFEQWWHSPLYESADDVKAVLDRPACAGIYMHEVIVWSAGNLKWDYRAAVSKLDFKWLDAVVAKARAVGKQVVWSEPAASWEYVYADRNAMAHMKSYGDVLTPVFATNFQCAGSGYLMARCRDYAAAVAGRIGSGFGESHQDWFFSEQKEMPTPDTSCALARWGLEHNASTFQFEGTYSDMNWDSPYMQGVRKFASLLNGK